MSNPSQGQKAWRVISQLVETLYATDPSERLGLVEPVLEDEFPYLTRQTLDATANTIYRLVAFLCEHDTYGESPNWTKVGRHDHNIGRRNS